MAKSDLDNREPGPNGPAWAPPPALVPVPVEAAAWRPPARLDRLGIGSGELALLDRVAILTVVCLLLSLFISFDFWLPQRAYPLAPVLGFDPGDAAAQVILAALLASLAAAALLPLPRAFLVVPCFLILLLVLADQSRLQPYIYMYTAALAVVAVSGRPAFALPLQDSLRLICASAYLWSGVQKMNGEFYSTVFPWFVRPLRAAWPFSGEIYAAALSLFGFATPVFEALIGLLLIANVHRAIPLAMAAVMLGVVLFCLGPLGHRWNMIVWPWNIWLFTLTVWLFWRQPAPTGRLLTLRPGAPYLVKAAVLLMFGVMPPLSLAKLWDGYLSFKLYSGNTYQASVSVGKEDSEKFPPSLERFAQSGSFTISSVTFGLYEVAPYPERRVYLAVWREWCERHELTSSQMRITYQSRFYGRRDRQETFSCPED